MTDEQGQEALSSPTIIPLQRTLMLRVVQVSAAVMLLWFAVFMALNDRSLGRLITKIVTSQVSGEFKLGSAHYDYWSSLGSLILNTQAPVVGQDFELRDPTGALVMKAKRVEARMYVGELVRGLLRSAVSAPFGRGVFIELHFASGTVHGAWAGIHPISLPRPPGVVVPPVGTPYTEVNIVAAMSSRKPKPEDAPPSPGHVRILVDSPGVTIQDAHYEMAFSGWHGHVDGLTGTATLRMSTDAAETRPGLISFVYEIAKATAEQGELVLGTKEGAGEFVFPLRNIALRRFGARASRRQDLVFRGQLEAAGATVEIDGSLLDTYCDPGVRLELSFEHGAKLAGLIPGGLIKQSGDPRGRVRFFGPFSSTLPQTPRGRPAPCLSEPWHQTPYPIDPEERSVGIEGQVGGVEAEVATIAIHQASTPFQLIGGELLMSRIVGQALGGEVRAEPMKISFVGDMPWSARISMTSTDPAQVELVPPFLRPFVAGKLRGAFRASGHLAKQAHPERVSVERVEATLERIARRDPLPKEVKLTGSFLYNPDLLSFRGLYLNGEVLSVDVERGSVGMKNGKLDIPAFELRGRGASVGRIVQFVGQAAGVSSSAEEGKVKVRIAGRLARPELLAGELSLAGIDLAGQRFTDASTSFELRDGTLSVSRLQAQGPLGSVRGEGTTKLFLQDVSSRPADPAMTLSAQLERINLDVLRSVAPLAGSLDGQIRLTGTWGKPIGSLAARVPSLLVQGSRLHDLLFDAELATNTITLRSLSTRMGSGQINASAVMRRDGDRFVDFTLKPSRVPLRELPGVASLPFDLGGTLSGAVRILGATAPLLPRLDGQLQVDDVTISGRASNRAEPTRSLLPSEPDPLFSLFGMAVTALALNQGKLKFSERPDGGTLVQGQLFNEFNVDGLVYLDPAHPRGELRILFGCNSKPSPTTSPRSDGAASPASEANTTRSAACDMVLGRLLPDLRQLGDVSAFSSGSLTLRFGDDPRDLFAANGGAMAQASCPQLATRPLQKLLGLPVAATLRLGRLLLEIHAYDDEGDEQRYRVHNRGDVLLCTDGRNLELGQVVLLSQRQNISANPVVRGPGTTAAHGETSGQASLQGLLSPDDTDLRLRGQIRLELLESFLRASFRHAHGDALVDVALRGKSDSLRLLGRAEIKDARFIPNAIDTPIEVKGGVLDLTPGRATLHGLRAIVDGAETMADGTVDLQSLSPLRFGSIDFRLHGDLSAQLLQWQFARNLAEARGKLALRGLHITGSFVEPIAEGTLVAKDLFLNLRRFHELYFAHGTIAFRPGSGKAGRILVGCVSGNINDPPGCEPLSGSVDGDGRVQLNGRIEHSGLGGFMRPNWYQALDRVRSAVVLENVRHTVAGVYNVEVTTPAPGLQIVGNQDEMRVLGNVEVVSGRYMQDFDLTERFLSARRVIEEEAPFWEGDPFLSGLLLGLNVRTRGTFRVLNNIADLRLATNDFAVNGPLENVAMHGVIRVESGFFNVPGLRSEFQVRGDSKIDFSSSARWPETPFVEIRGSARELDQNAQQRNIELALRGKVKELRIDCLSSDNMSAADCASFLVLGESGSDPRRTVGVAGNNPRALQYGDPAAKLLSSQLLTNQVTDPLREKLRLDTVRIQFGVSSFDVQLCKRFGLYLRMCGLAEWGLFGSVGNRYRGFGELQLSDITVGQVSLERIERGFSFLEDTINRFKVQAGFRLPLRY
ncbi:MAG: translocation/assembly module TamB domain-containing protein [Myxococcales bacterium]|nr:translocation/assembly module TamB domain-containing protein [Myxococcales bacterium]